MLDRIDSRVHRWAHASRGHRVYGDLLPSGVCDVHRLGQGRLRVVRLWSDARARPIADDLHPCCALVYGTHRVDEPVLVDLVAVFRVVAVGGGDDPAGHEGFRSLVRGSGEDLQGGVAPRSLVGDEEHTPLDL